MKRNFVFLTVFLLGLFLNIYTAYANIMINPFRLVFEDRTRSQIVYVINRSNETHTFRIEWFDTFADSNGQYVFEDKMTEAQKSQIKPAEKMIRFSPRQVVLGPGQRQAIRVAIRKPANLEPGEYRSHILFKQLAKPESSLAEPVEPDTMGIKLYLNLSVSIPIIVRHGDLSSGAKIVDAKMSEKYSDEQKDEFIFTLERKGDAETFASTYGGIKVYDANDTDRSTPLAQVNNIYVFPEQESRIAKALIEERIPSSVKRFTAVYEGYDEYKNEIFSEFTFER